jgi:hypothetical protein
MQLATLQLLQLQHIGCRLKETTSDRNRGSSSLERLLKHKQRVRKLWHETRDPACKTAVKWVTKTKENRPDVET